MRNDQYNKDEIGETKYAACFGMYPGGASGFGYRSSEEVLDFSLSALSYPQI
jgi:hypothetical protein